ncbi:MAG: histidine phosphatase family protein [Bacteroidota bacterium]|nr:histidine phosphatase family protein [Bacteroidota bacterium]
MLLYFLRHADAATSGYANDFDRELTDEGKTEAEYVRRAIRGMKLSFTDVLCSPCVRARQTAKIVLGDFPALKIEDCDCLTSSSDPANLFGKLSRYPGDGKILLVTHEPFASMSIASLLSGSSEPKISMKKASVACIETRSPVQRRTGTLLWLLANEQMKLLLS